MAAMTEYHTSIAGIEMPDRIKRLPVDHRGFPVPRFVATVEGQPDHRIMRGELIMSAVRERRCWICGDKLGRYYVSIIGCMCAVNRVISEPPSHRDCAEFSVQACPFLARPHAHRREAGMPENRKDSAGFGLKRNPGVTCLWVSRKFPTPFRAHAGQPGWLFQLHDPVETVWYREGRLATREEVEAAIEDGLPLLQAEAARESTLAVAALVKMVNASKLHLPAALAA